MRSFIKLLHRTSAFQLKEEKFIQRIGLISIAVSLTIIMLIMSFFVLYTKQRRQKDLISDGVTLTSIVAQYFVNDLEGDNASNLLKIVNYTGSKSGLIYGTIMDRNQHIVAYRGRRYDDNTDIARRAALSNNPLKQTYKDSRTNHMIYEFSRPLFVNGKREGTVRLGFAPDIYPLFSDDDIRGILLVITLFFSLVPIFYYLVRGSLRLHTLSITDELTGLYNRRGFFTFAEDCLMSARRTGKRLMLLYADLDNLKEINDSSGHEAGDRLIKETAAILKSTFRTSDIIARVGGDEFVVFPVGNEEDHAAAIAVRLHENIDTFNAKSNNKYKLRISSGIATYDPNSVKSITELLAEADDLMYKDKRSKNTDRGRPDLHAGGHTFPG